MSLHLPLPLTQAKLGSPASQTKLGQLGAAWAFATLEPLLPTPTPNQPQPKPLLQPPLLPSPDACVRPGISPLRLTMTPTMPLVIPPSKAAPTPTTTSAAPAMTPSMTAASAVITPAMTAASWTRAEAVARTSNPNPTLTQP